MKKPLIRLIRLLCLVCFWGPALAQVQLADGGLEVATEQARITSERQRIEQRFAEEETACFQKFAVTDCRDASRARRRVDMADLRRQEIALNDAERKRKGAEQLQRMEQSAATKDQPPVAAGIAAPRAASSAPVRTRTPPEPRTPRSPHDPAAAAQAQAARKATAENKARNAQQEQAARAQKAAAAADAPARYAQKQQEAADHKAAIAKRNAAKTKPKAAPLPTTP
jgi:colicin import membrane protein